MHERPHQEKEGIFTALLSMTLKLRQKKKKKSASVKLTTTYAGMNKYCRKLPVYHEFQNQQSREPQDESLS
jgi:hypothetical protein